MASHHHHSAVPLVALTLAAAAGGAWLWRQLKLLDDHIHTDIGQLGQAVAATRAGAMQADAHIADVVNQQGAAIGQMRRDTYGSGPGPHD